MNNIAFLIGNIVIYWNQIVAVLGIIAGCVFVFALRPYTKIKIKALIFWMPCEFILSFLLSRLLYFYCDPEQPVSFGALFTGITDRHYSAMGLLAGTYFASWIIWRFHLVKHLGNLLDTVSPGVVLMLALTRLSYLFTDTFHSTLTVASPFWHELPFAVQTTDTAGNTSYVFAPFFISFLFLVFTAIVITILRNRFCHPGDLFYVTFTCYALSEIVLESTRYDSPKWHLHLLTFLNPYVSFISFSMVVCGACLIVTFIFKFLEAQNRIDIKKKITAVIMFSAGIIGFGICEYLLQRYTTLAVLFHWIQVIFAAAMGIGIILLVYYRNKQKNSLYFLPWAKEKISIFRSKMINTDSKTLHL